MNSETMSVLNRTIDNLVSVHTESLLALQNLKELIGTVVTIDPHDLSRLQTEAWTGCPPMVDHSMLSVAHQGKNCFLGNTLSFRLLVRLLRRPNHYVSHQILLDEIWDGIRSPEAVRSVVKTLRAKLRVSGLDVLSRSIDGTVKGHYAILIAK